MRKYRGFRVYVTKPGPNDGACWRLLCKAPAGSGVKPLRRSSGTTDKAEALAIARAKEAQLNARPLPGLTPDPTVSDVLRWYLDVRSKDGTRGSTLVSYGTFARRLGDVLGALRSSEITWPAIKLLPIKETKKRPYDPAEVRAVLDWLEVYMGGHYAPLFNVLAESGARVGEVVALLGADVDRPRCLLRFRRETTKTDEAREVGITRATMDRVPEARAGLRVFRSRQRPDQVLATNSVLAVLRSAVEALEIPDGDDLDLHSFRRTFSVEAERAEVPERLAMKQTGHQDVKTHRGYKRRARGDDMHGVAEAVAARWAAPGPESEEVVMAPSPPAPDSARKPLVPMAASGSSWTERGGASGPSLPGVATNGHDRAHLAPASPARPDAPALAHGQLPRDPHAATLSAWARENPGAMWALLNDPARLVALRLAMLDALPGLEAPASLPDARRRLP